MTMVYEINPLSKIPSTEKSTYEIFFLHKNTFKHYKKVFTLQLQFILRINILPAMLSENILFKGL